MKRLSTIIMALVLALGLTQCKKNEQPTTENQGETYNITLNVKGNNGAKVDVNTTTGSVNFQTGDMIHVASAGKYVGTLTYDGTVFAGAIGNATEGQPLQFYFLGNVDPAETLSIGTSESCSVVISDQTTHLPLISAAPSVENFYGEVTEYTAELKNKCALVKFNVTTSSAAPTCVVGFNNKVMIDFAENTITNSMEGDGSITLPAGSGEKWAILLPQESMTGGSAYASGDEYAGTFGAVPAMYVNGYFPAGIPVEVTTSTHNYLVDLSTLTGDYQAINGDTLTGTLTSPYKITIAENATVTLLNININPNGTFNYSVEGGITSHYDATIVLKGTNTIKYWNEQRPSIYISQNKTLTITGTGSLNASGIMSAAIGAGYSYPCGNIVIESGDITASTLASGAGIGGAHSTYGTCGTITINGGTINVTSNSGGCGIGGGQSGGCGNITINGGNITATSTGGSGIGGSMASCGIINISGGTVNTSGSRAGIGGGYSGTIAISGGTIIASGQNGAGIGSGTEHYNGITISGGNITASSTNGAGIGAGFDEDATCGNISITGGTITATGGNYCAGIGASRWGSCASVSIDNTVT